MKKGFAGLVGIIVVLSFVLLIVVVLAPVFANKQVSTSLETTFNEENKEFENLIYANQVTKKTKINIFHQKVMTEEDIKKSFQQDVRALMSKQPYRYLIGVKLPKKSDGGKSSSYQEIKFTSSNSRKSLDSSSDAETKVRMTIPSPMEKMATMYVALGEEK